MDNSKIRQQNDLLGVNKMGKNIRKSPLHQPNFANNANNRPQPQPQVYNISKNEFRSIVQRLTGSPSHDPSPKPPPNPPKPQSMRLQKIRPPPLTPINQPHVPPPVPAPAVVPPPSVPFNNDLVRPGQFGHPHPSMTPPMAPGNLVWENAVESPISAYMRYFQNAMMNPSPRGNQAQPSLQQPQAQGPGYTQSQPPSSGLLPNPHFPPLPSPQMNGLGLLSSPQMNGPGLIPSPTSQFLLPSPTGYMNLLSSQSPYPLFSPGFQFPPPLTPNFAFSPMAQSGILGHSPQPPPSPGFAFPSSPAGFFPSLKSKMGGSTVQ